MNIKKLMLATLLLLAILTIGAVSASDDISDEALAVDDDAQDSIGESCVDEILEDTDSGDNNLKSTPEAEIALSEPLDEDSNIIENATDNDILQSSEEDTLSDHTTYIDFTVPKSVPIDEAGKVLIHVKQVCDGELNLYVDGTEVDEGFLFVHQAPGDYSYYLPVYESCGTHDYRIEYAGDGSHEPVTLTGTFEVTSYGGNPDYNSFFGFTYPKRVLVGEDATVWVHFKEGCSGQLTLYVDGNLEDEGYGLDNPLPGYFDLYLPVYDSCGDHNFRIDYGGDGTHEALSATGSFKVIYNIDVNVSDAYYGLPATINVVLPSGVEKEYFNVTVNGKPYTASIEDGLTFSDWKVGNNTITATYEGDDSFPENSVTKTFNVKPKILPSDDDAIYNSTEAVYLILPDDATGKLIVSDGDYTIDEITVKGGRNIWIPSEGISLGLNTLKFSYEGNYEADDELISFEVIPEIRYPMLMYAKGQENLTMLAPEQYNGTFSVEIREVGPYFYPYGYSYGNVTFSDSCNLTNGKGTIALHDIDTGLQAFFIEYADANGYSYEKVIQFFVFKDAPDADYNVTFDRDEYAMGYLEAQIVDELPNWNGNYRVTIDGIPFEVEYANIYYSTFAHVLCISSLDVGPHTAVITRYNDSYYEDSSKVFHFNITPISFLLEGVIDVDQGILVRMAEGIEGLLTIMIDGEVFFNETVDRDYFDGGYYEYWDDSIPFDGLAIRNHTYELTLAYNGEKYTRNGTFDMDYDIYVNTYDTPYGESVELEIYIPPDDGNLTVSVGGKAYTVQVTDAYYTRIMLSNLTFGENVIFVTYNGNDMYPPKTVNETVNIYPNFNAPEEFLYTEDKLVSLTMPEDATGTLTATLGNDTFTSNLTNGKATINLTGTYEIGSENNLELNYVGNYGNHTCIGIFTIAPNVTIPVLSTKGEHVVTVRAPDDFNGEFFFRIGSARYTADIINGSANVTLSGLNSGSNFINLKFNAGGCIYEDRFYVDVYGEDDVFELDVDFPSEILPNQTWEYELVMPQYANGNITVMIDGNPYGAFKSKGNNYYNYADLAVDFEGLSFGPHTIQFVYSGDRYYKATNSSLSEFNVTNLAFPHGIHAGFYTSENQNNYVIEALGLEGTLTVLIDEVEIESKEIKGPYVITLNDITTGIHNYTLIFEGKDSGFTKKGQFNVTYDASFITDDGFDVDDGYFIYGDDYTFVLQLPRDATGSVNLTFEGVTYQSEIINGNATFKFDELVGKGGYNDIAVIYSGDGKYYSRNITAVINMLYDISLEVVNNTVLVAGVKLPSDATGTLYVYIEEDEYSVDLVNGSAVFTKSDLEMGRYFVYVRLYCNEYSVFGPSNTVTIASASKVDPQLKINVSDVDLGKNAVVEISINDIIEGTVTVNVDGKNYTIFVDWGGGSLLLSGLKAGNHTVKAFYAGDEFFLNASDSMSFNVRAIIQNPDLIVTANDITVGEKAIIDVTINPYATGDVIVNVDGENHTVEIENGHGILELSGLAFGEHIIRATYNGNANFTADEKTRTFMARKTSGLEVSASDIYVGENATVLIKINENATGEIAYSFNNTVIPVAVSEGMANVTFTGLEMGTYSVTVTFKGDEEFAAHEVTVTFRVNGKDADVETPKIDNVKSDEEVVIEFPDDAKGNVTLTVNGQDYVFEVKNGKAIVKIPNLDNGNFEYSLVYSGDDNYAAKTLSNGTFKVENAPSKPSDGNQGAATPASPQSPTAPAAKTESISLTLKKVKVRKSAKKLVIKATLKINGKPAKGKVLKFKFNGKTYKAKTNKKGVAKITIKKKFLKRLKVGKKVKYQVSYGKTTKKLSVKVKK